MVTDYSKIAERGGEYGSPSAAVIAATPTPSRKITPTRVQGVIDRVTRAQLELGKGREQLALMTAGKQGAVPTELKEIGEILQSAELGQVEPMLDRLSRVHAEISSL